jgi:hypothetical protein
MQDPPRAPELIEAVREFLERILPELKGHSAFHGRVAANVLDIVKRELELAPTTDAAEHARLRVLLGTDGTLDELNRLLCQRITSGEMPLEAPGLIEHLRETTLAKLAVDQPRYPGYRRALARWGRQDT